MWKMLYFGIIFRMKSSERKIAMTDLETSGDIFGVHEILEIGLVVFDPNTFEIVDTYNQKVRPIRIENAVHVALEYNGYNEKDWKEAISLDKAIKIYSEKLKNEFFLLTKLLLIWAL